MESAEFLNLVSELPRDTIRAATRDSLLVGAPFLGFQPRGEGPEDLIVRLLRETALAPNARLAMIEACEDVVIHLIRATSTGKDCIDPDLAEAYIRVCRIMDIASPPELSPWAVSALRSVIALSGVDSNILAAAVRSNMGYEPRLMDIPIWEDVLQQPSVAAYAFTSLLRISPYEPRIETFAESLLVNATTANWPVSVLALLRNLIQAQGADAGACRVLRRIHDGHRTAWVVLENELLKKSWSAKLRINTLRMSAPTALAAIKTGAAAYFNEEYVQKVGQSGAISSAAEGLRAGSLMLSVVIPVYNEVDNLDGLHQRLTHELDRTAPSSEIIFVDDGSKDRSFAKLQEIWKVDPRVTVIRLKYNSGISAALIAGFDKARGNFVLTMAADLQDQPEELRRLIDKMDEGYDLVLGWRYKRFDPIHKTLPSRLFNRAVSGYYRLAIHDLGSSFRLMKAEVARSLRLYGDYHRFVPVLASCNGFRVTEVVVAHAPRIYGLSKYGAMRFFISVVTLADWIRNASKRKEAAYEISDVLPAGGPLLGRPLQVPYS